MFKVLKIDGGNITTDLGGISLTPLQYADGGKSRPVNGVDFGRMLRLFVAAPALADSLREMVDMFERHIDGRPGPDDAAARWDRARDALAQADAEQPEDPADDIERPDGRTPASAKADAVALRYAGMMGHTFCVIFDHDDHNDRRIAGETCDLAEARRWAAEHAEAGANPAIYRKDGDRWTLTA
jgi:hypothetical protein